MAEEPIVRNELLQMIQRLDERISSLDRNMTLMRENLNDAVKDLRADNRQVRTWIFGLYMAVIGVAAVAVAIVK
jgi:hypothetical protein